MLAVDHPILKSQGAMLASSKLVSIHPYFRARPGKLAQAKALLPQFVALTATESANLFYDFTLKEDVIFCREAYVGAEGLLHHIENIGSVLAEFLKLVDVLRVEIHGSPEELHKLKDPLAHLNPEWFELQCGVSK